MWIAALASIPKTIDVAILDKHAPVSIEVAGEGCGTKRLRARGDAVRLCDARDRCEDVPAVAIACRGPATIRFGGKQRSYGRRLRIEARGGALRIVTAMDLEAYVAGVVAAEITRAPEAAIEAQAIVTRTFALRAIDVPRHPHAHVCDLTHCQVLRGAGQAPIAPGAHLVDRRSKKLAVVFFHSTCGGETIDPRSVWPDIPSLDGVADVDPDGKAYCAKSPHHRWISEIPEDRLAEALEGLSLRRLDPSTLELALRDGSFRVKDVHGEDRIDADAMHQHLAKSLGFSKVKSNAFGAARAGRTFILSGRGLGHRVGLCQHGAIERARRGATALEILAAYFPSLEVAR
jgi:stage II sporulation protein D